MQSYSFPQVFTLFAIFVLFTIGGCNDLPDTQKSLQQQLNLNVQQALKRFQHLQRSDTIDFVKLTPFDWDTVYVFNSHIDTKRISSEMERTINWEPAMASSDFIPEETTRFIFVKANEAVSYVDISRDLIGEAHFAKYYPDTLGRVTTSYIDLANHVHQFTVNHFAKADARFILVCAVRIPMGNAVRGAYLPLQLLKEKQFSSLGIKPTNLVDLHPISGCGYANCLANSLRQ